jgi:hypothetical protein
MLEKKIKPNKNNIYPSQGKIKKKQEKYRAFKAYFKCDIFES